MQQFFEQIWIIARGIWLKKRYIVLVSWAVCISGWIAVTTIPDQYQASARVYVNTQTLLKPLLQGLTLNANAQQQVNLMVKTLLSRPNLEKILRMVDMDILTNNKTEFDALVDSLSKKIKMSATTRENLYTISFSGADPSQAEDVVKAVLKVFVENTMGQSRSDTLTARNFLNEQINEYEKRLAKNEQQLTEFKQLNGNLIVGRDTGYYNVLKQYQDQYERSNLLLIEKQTQLKMANQQLAGEMPSFGILLPRLSQSITTQFDQRIASLEQRLDQLILRYTEQHPDVIEVTNRLAKLNQLRVQEVAEFSRLYDENGVVNSALNENPVFQEMRLNVINLEKDIAAITVRVKAYKDKVVNLKSKINLIPEVEAKLTALNRGYLITKQKYEEMLRRRESALLSEKADLSVDDIQFKVIDPPRVKPKPVGPNRFFLNSVVLILGIGSGVGIAFLLSQLSSVVLTPFQLTQISGYPVLGSVSLSGNETIIRKNSIKNVLFASLLLGLVIVYAGILIVDVSVPINSALPMLTLGGG